MKKITLLIILALSFSISFAQNKTALKYANMLDSLKMKKTLTKLASDEFRGRKTGTNEIKLAENYLVNLLKSYKIKPGNKNSYLQNINASVKIKNTKYFNLGNFNYKDSYSYKNEYYQDTILTIKDFVFAGYGIYHSSYNEFNGIDISNKGVIIFANGEPRNKYGVPYHSETYSKIPNNKFLKSQKPKAIFKIYNNFDKYRNYSSSSINFSSVEDKDKKIPTININEVLANKLLSSSNTTVKQIIAKIEKNGEPVTFSLKNNLTLKSDKLYKQLDLNNVVGFIEGSDLKDEYIVICAHYDHIGTSYSKKIYYGADDNASGVSSILEIARVFNKAKKNGKGPRRSIIILFPTAEEDGLYGSKYYVDNPIFPLKKTIACVNIDMLGRMGKKASKKDIEKGYVFALSERSGKTNDKLHNIITNVNNNTTKLNLLTKDGSYYSSFFARSDHYSFYKKDINSVIFTNGSHKDLHSLKDKVEKIDFKAMHRRSKLVFLTLWDLANKTKPFEVKNIIKEDIIDNVEPDVEIIEAEE